MFQALSLCFHSQKCHVIYSMSTRNFRRSYTNTTARSEENLEKCRFKLWKMCSNHLSSQHKRFGPENISWNFRNFSAEINFNFPCGINSLSVLTVIMLSLSHTIKKRPNSRDSLTPSKLKLHCCNKFQSSNITHFPPRRPPTRVANKSTL